jgi:hypothetical protein
MGVWVVWGVFVNALTLLRGVVIYDLFKFIAVLIINQTEAEEVVWNE